MRAQVNIYQCVIGWIYIQIIAYQTTGFGGNALRKITLCRCFVATQCVRSCRGERSDAAIGKVTGGIDAQQVIREHSFMVCLHLCEGDFFGSGDNLCIIPIAFGAG